MTALEARTDLFDLFGQEGTCTICMETLRDGDRVRAVRGCDHMFHQACVEPWLLSRGTCPMCRAEVVPVQAAAPAALGSTADALERLQAAVLALNPAATTRLQPVLDQIQQLLGQARGNLGQRKASLAYALGMGIAARHPTAAAFNAVRETLATRFQEFQFEGIAPDPLVFTNRSAFVNSYRGCAGRSTSHNAVAARLRTARASSQFLQDFWRTD